ncbi:hypothetical protein [Microbispora sp. H10836]|uniref:hypothetical protein n=1 Tax=Microbispora sp. H10836 TaxID=2729106 RepID=UPI001473D523|nr:hypothetical protein [Microbispora sp. H10836]
MTELAEEASIREVQRQRRVVDQQLTIYSLLRDRYRRYSTTLTLLMLGGSVLTAGFAFATDSPEIIVLGVSASRTTWMGWLSLLLFFSSLMEMTMDWRKKAERCDDMTRKLGVLKHEYRGLDLSRISQAKTDELCARYRSVMADSPAIKDRQFVRLKAAHVRKVELSRLVADYPGASMLSLRYYLWRRRRRK